MYLLCFSVNSTDIVIKFHDPEKYLKQATKIQYFWFIDDVAYGQTNQVVCTALYNRDEETNLKKIIGFGFGLPEEKKWIRI